MDTIWGRLDEVVDGDTFDMQVTREATANEYNYNDKERIRIEDIDAPELGRTGARSAAEDLALCLDGRSIRCDVQARDTYGRLICDVTAK